MPFFFQLLIKLSSESSHSSHHCFCFFHQSVLNSQKDVIAVKQGPALGVETGRDHHTVANHQHNNADLKGKVATKNCSAYLVMLLCK